MAAKKKGPSRFDAAIPWRKRFHWRSMLRWRGKHRQLVGKRKRRLRLRDRPD
jgi:hypothetical protein